MSRVYHSTTRPWFYPVNNMAPPEGVGHRFSPAGDPVDPGTAPSCLRHSTSVTQAKFVGTKSPPNFPGAPGGSRTPNLFLRRELLYPLSYEGVATLYLYYQIAQNSTIIPNCPTQKNSPRQPQSDSIFS